MLEFVDYLSNKRDVYINISKTAAAFKFGKNKRYVNLVLRF